MKFFTVVFALCVAAPAFASPGDVLFLGSSMTQISGPNGRELTEKVMDDIPGILRLYQPLGATIKDKKVLNPGPRGLPTVSFIAAKSFLGHTISKKIEGDVTRSNIACKAPANASGYRIDLDLTNSDSGVVDSISRFLVDFCLVQNTDGSIQVNANGFMTEGKAFDVMAGGFIKGMLKQQVPALTDAFRNLAIEYSH